MSAGLTQDDGRICSDPFIKFNSEKWGKQITLNLSQRLRNISFIAVKLRKMSIVKSLEANSSFDENPWFYLEQDGEGLIRKLIYRAMRETL